MAEIETSMVLQNAFNGETFVFPGGHETADVSRFDVVLDRGGSGGGNALVHVHPLAEERFIVRSGRLKVVIRGIEESIEAGQSAVVPPGAPHYFVNDSQGPTMMTVEFRPAQQFTKFFANFGKLTERHPEWFSKNGDPHLLLIAVTFQAYPNHLYLAGVPIWLQKLLFGVLAPIARWRGYRTLIAPALHSMAPGSHVAGERLHQQIPLKSPMAIQRHNFVRRIP